MKEYIIRAIGPTGDYYEVKVKAKNSADAFDLAMPVRLLVIDETEIDEDEEEGD